jgi:hypothetical protein
VEQRNQRRLVTGVLRRPVRVIKNGPITFSIGATVGGLAGFVLGALLGKYALHVLSLLIGAIDRRGTSDEDRLKFELLLQ